MIVNDIIILSAGTLVEPGKCERRVPAGMQLCAGMGERGRGRVAKGRGGSTMMVAISQKCIAFVKFAYAQDTHTHMQRVGERESE